MDVPSADDIRIVEQTIHDGRTGAVVATELLARFPGESDTAAVFERAEANGLLREFDLRALRAALRYSRGVPSRIQVHVNLFPSTLRDYGCRRVLEVEARVRPGLVVELHEGRSLSVLDLSSFVSELAPGVSFALDDVGSDCSLVSDILSPCISLLKLDRAVVSRIESDRLQAKRLELLLRMLRTTGLPVVAEGVETEAALSVLQGLGVEMVQGYLFGRPAERLTWRRSA